MATLQRYLPSTPGQLLGYILERPELVAAVRELPGTALWRLIDRVGLEDCGELIALASGEQLEAILDADLWRADESGFEERFDPQRFSLWLQVLGEAGDDFLTRRLCELPLDLLTLAVHRLVLVIDMDALSAYLAGARDEAGEIERALDGGAWEEWEEFRLVARDPDVWPDVWSALLLLDREHHARLRGILERCCAMTTEYVDGRGGLYEVLTSEEMLESDARAEREDRRAQLGFVSRGDAHSFLQLARTGQVAGRRDPITAAYFRAVGAADRSARTDGVRRLTAPAGAGVQGLLQLITTSEAEPGQLRSAPRSLPRSSATRRTQTRLAEALAALSSEHPEAHSARMEELAYLANVLIAGCTHAGNKLRPVQALEAVVATCNLGLELSQRAQPAVRRERPAQLLQRVACDQLFREAWQALQGELVQPARDILAARCSKLDAARARRAQKLVQDGAAFALRTVCDGDELELDEASFEGLLTLAEELPWRARAHARGGPSPWLASRADFDRCRRLLLKLRGAAGRGHT